MEFSKKNAQYFAMAIEQTVDALINHTPLDYSDIAVNKDFSDKNKKQFLSDAQDIVASYFSTAKKSVYCGRHTKTEVADFIIDGQNVELKYVSGNCAGTYFNTSISYCEQLGFIPYYKFLEKNHTLDELETIISHPIYEKYSPVTQSESSELRHNQKIKPILDLIKKKELKARKEYVNSFYSFLIKNNLIEQFYYDMINKYSKDSKPDVIVIYNFNTKQHVSYTPLMLKDLTHSCVGCSITINQIRITFGWQNGTPLNNPTLRVFFK